MSFECTDRKAVYKLAELQADNTFNELEECKKQLEAPRVGNYKSNYAEKNKVDGKAARQLQIKLKSLKYFL